jgi:hypothetical protein
MLGRIVTPMAVRLYADALTCDWLDDGRVLLPIEVLIGQGIKYGFGRVLLPSCYPLLIPSGNLSP